MLGGAGNIYGGGGGGIVVINALNLTVDGAVTVAENPSLQTFKGLNSLTDISGKNSQGWGYAVFGKIVEGMEVVNAITEMETGSAGHHQDVPVETIEVTETLISDAYSDK